MIVQKSKGRSNKRRGAIFQMNQKLDVAFGSLNGRLYQAAALQTDALCRARNFFNRLRVYLRVAHNAAAPHLLASRFELRFDERNDLSVGFEKTFCRR